MSNLPGNPYEEEALRYSTEASLINDWNAKDREVWAKQATIQATLALAYEQRTANLIAFMSHADSDQYEAIWRVMNVRLGLGENDA